MYIDDKIDSILAEALEPHEYNQLVKEGISDRFKQGFVSSMVKHITQSITRCTSDSMVKNDIFKEIEKSKGDITKFEYSRDMDETRKLMDLISDKSNSSSPSHILRYLEDRKYDFMKGFKNNNLVVKMIYTGLASSLIINTSSKVNKILGVNKPSTKLADVVCDNLYKSIDNHTIDKVLKNQDKFAITESSGSEEKIFTALGLGSLVGAGSLGAGFGGVAIAAISITAIIVLLLSIKLIVFYIYESRIRLSDYLYQNAMLLELHETEVKSNASLSDEEKEAIIAKQKKMSELLLRISEKIAVDNITSKRKAEEANGKDNRQIVDDSRDDNEAKDDGDIVI